MTTDSTLPEIPPFPVLPQENSHRVLWVAWARSYAMQAVTQERERILAKAKSRYDQVKAAVHHAGRWQNAYDYHMTRQGAMSEMMDIIQDKVPDRLVDRASQY